MARNTLTMADRIKIITLMEQNMRQVDVANILHVNQSIVSRLWRKFQETQPIADRPREGRPRKRTPGQDRYVRLSARRNPIASATTLRHDLREATGVVVSSQTVRNRLHDIGLYARRPLKTPALRPHHRDARARWARAHENWTRDQWTRTLFSDEVRMGLHPDNNSIRVWRRTGERNHPLMTVERHQQFGGSILFWAGVMFGRRTPLDDNARPHRAHSVQRYLVEHGIRRIDWPSCSPDMNCIEHAWSFLRRAISNRPHHPLTIQELRNAALEEWDNLPQESLDALVLSMPRRIQECLRVLRKIFGAKRDEVTGEWRKLHNAELHALYSSPDIIRNIKCRRLRWAGHVARMGDSRNAYRVLVGRPRRRWEDNMKMDLREVEYDGRDWINLAQDRDQWRAYGSQYTIKEIARKLVVAWRPEDMERYKSIESCKTTLRTGRKPKSEKARASKPAGVREICVSIKCSGPQLPEFECSGPGTRRLRWAGHVARMGESRNAYRVLVGRSDGKRPLGRRRYIWEDNIKMDLREVGYDGRDWINLAQDRDQWRAYVRAAMNLRVP
ncbi:hypothetical protein ANN_03884 [Periplaneta americana]|uniref:Transposase n=1 Tax=Periplaneta americana TaxID=6978 RepID=A0ABQ8U011_PERAM|nr:hypothetical protein ANN_03884 [Periplaneta americana]